MGAVYIMTNPSLPSVIKIGKSKNAVNRRRQLSKTSTPFEFILNFQIETKDHDLLEKLAQKSLARYRVNKRREFFEIDVDTAKSQILEIANNLENGLKYIPMKPISDEEIFHLESPWNTEF